MAVYHGEDDHIELLNEAAGLFSVSNPLHSSTWPSVNKARPNLRPSVNLETTHGLKCWPRRHAAPANRGRSAGQFEAEVIAMTASLVNGGDGAPGIKVVKSVQARSDGPAT